MIITPTNFTYIFVYLSWFRPEMKENHRNEYLTILQTCGSRERFISILSSTFPRSGREWRKTISLQTSMFNNDFFRNLDLMYIWYQFIPKSILVFWWCCQTIKIRIELFWIFVSFLIRYKSVWRKALQINVKFEKLSIWWVSYLTIL